ncbi:hypothetical protein FXO38_13099 [Capsicum annuum]|nr:hypothetical protein FXO38_13099 [Capsicum annuum]
MDTIVILQFTWGGGGFLSDPILKLDSDADALRFTNSLKSEDFVDVYVVHQISEPIVVNDDVAATPPLLLLSDGDVAAPFETDRPDVSSSKPLDINENKHINENKPPRADRGKAKVSSEDLEQGQVNDFSTYYLQTSDSEVDFDTTDFDGDSLYDVDEKIKEFSDFDKEFLQARKSNIEKQAKKGLIGEGARSWSVAPKDKLAFVCFQYLSVISCIAENFQVLISEGQRFPRITPSTSFPIVQFQWFDVIVARRAKGEN